MKKFSKFAIAIFSVALFFTSCASSPKETARDPNAEYHLVVLHTNDHHGAVLSKDGKNGLAERATYVKQQREESKNAGKDFLLLDAGDVNIGSAISNMTAAEVDIMAYNAIGYDAVTFGNHEFDGTYEKILKQIKISKFPWLSANIKTANGYLGKPYITKKFAGYKVGIFGLTTLRTLITSSPDKSLTFTDEIETAKEMVATLRNKEKCDIVILVGHLGDVEESPTHKTSLKIADAVDSIDFIIDGHSHSYFAEPKIVNNTQIVSSEKWGHYVGTAEFTIKDGKIENFAWHPEEITTKKFAPDAEIASILQPYVDKANASIKDVVLKITAPFEFGARLTRFQEMPSGDFLADAMVWYLEKTGIKVDGAITNGGGIRTAIPAGDVTKEAIMTMLPFENYVYAVTLKGSDVKDLFNFIGSIKQGAGAFAQVSKSIKYTITYDADGNGTISDVTINGEPIDENKTYRFACSDYTAKGGDGYEPFTRSIDTYNSSMILSDVFIEYAKTFTAAVTPKTDGRITIINGKFPK